jgi:NADPH:quinone reductase-like Zn-dependent oxidoreductase
MVEARRAIVRQFGRASAVTAVESFRLTPLADDRLRIRLTARAINPSDLITISGAYSSRTPLPFVPGFEAVGTVVDVGRAVTGFRAGMRVLPVGSAGGWQDFKDAEPDWCLPVPENLSDAAAARSYVNPMTAWLMMHEVADLSPGAHFVITAAGSTIGLMLVKLANLHGIRPFALVRSAEAQARLDGLDASVICAPTGEAQAARLREALGGAEARVVFDCVGGPAATGLARLLRPRGQFIHYGLLSGVPVAPEVWGERPDIRVELFHLRQWVHAAPPAVLRQGYARAADLIARGEIASPVRASFGLGEIRAALVEAENLTSAGKVLLIDP